MVSIQAVIEFLGTFAFAISGIRWAAFKNFDWFGGYVVGLATAIGGGTLRDVMIGATPFWMTAPTYLVCTGAALVLVILFSEAIGRFSRYWFLFDTLGLALFTMAGLQKTLDAGFPSWVAIFMGCMTGVAGGVLRDVLINEVPLVFRREIYALACIMGGLAYFLCHWLGVPAEMSVAVGFVVIVGARLAAVRYHISLPRLKTTGDEKDL